MHVCSKGALGECSGLYFQPCFEANLRSLTLKNGISREFLLLTVWCQWDLFLDILCQMGKLRSYIIHIRTNSYCSNYLTIYLSIYTYIHTYVCTIYIYKSNTYFTSSWSYNVLFNDVNHFKMNFICHVHCKILIHRKTQAYWCETGILIQRHGWRADDVNILQVTLCEPQC